MKISDYKTMINKALKHFEENFERDINIGKTEIGIFNQTWKNTSGGFQSTGKEGFVREPTVAIYNVSAQKAHVYFKGYLAYTTKPNSKFIKDFKNMDISGFKDYKKRYEGSKPKK